MVLFAFMTKNIFFFGDISQTFINFRLDLVEHLIAEGHCVSCFLNWTERDRNVVSELPIDIFEHGLRNRNVKLSAIFDAFYSLFRVARKSDVIVSYFFIPNLLSIVFSLFFSGRTVCFVEGLGQLGVDNLVGWKRLVLSIYAIILGRADAIIVLNKGDLSRLVNLNSALKNKVHLIQGIGVSTSYFVPSKSPDTSQDKNVVFIGRLLNEKGVRELVESAKTFINSPAVNFQFLGEYVEDGSGISRVEAAEIENHNRNVKFFGRVDVRPYLERAYLVCLPTRYGEGMPRVLLEAMACGRVVVTSNMSGCVELVEHGVTGFVFQREVSGGLTNCLSQCLNLTCDELMAIKSNARLAIEGRFSNEIILPQFAEVIAGRRP